MKFVNMTLFFVMFAVSCNISNRLSKHSTKSLQNKSECDSLYSFVKENWQYIEKDSIYSGTPEFFKYFNTEKKFGKCLSKMNISQMEGLLGKPHKKSTNALIYYLNKDCYKEVKYQCMGMIFAFGSTVSFINEPTISNFE